MADRVSVAVASDKALIRLVDAISDVDKSLLHIGVSSLAMPLKGRDPSYNNMLQLQALATWAESLAKLLSDETITIERRDNGESTETKTAKSGR